MGRLGSLIDEAASGSTSLATLLRNIKVVATRIGATELRRWADQELTGYDATAALPAYRASRSLPVFGTWSGPMGSSLKGQVSPIGVRDEFVKAHFMAPIRQPISELEVLAAADEDPGIQWDPWAVSTYDDMVNRQEGGIGYEFMALVAARMVVPRSMLVGVLDGIRNHVLDLALSLEGAAPDVGEPNGPTVADPAVQSAASSFVVNIYGDGANVALGVGARAASTVIKGDVSSLVQAALDVGLDEEAAAEFADAVRTDGQEGGERTRSFLDRVRSGAVKLSGDITSSIAASLLLQAAAAFLGGG